MDGNNFDLYNWLWTILGVPVLWVYNTLRSLSGKLEVTRQQLASHELHVAEKYVRYENFLRLETQILAKLERIEKKIDAKADK